MSVNFSVPQFTCEVEILSPRCYWRIKGDSAPETVDEYPVCSRRSVNSLLLYGVAPAGPKYSWLLELSSLLIKVSPSLHGDGIV